MNILDFIPYGKENAVKRSTLCALTGMNDRKVREMIEQEKRKGEIIINAQDGNGYYRSSDIADVMAQFRQTFRRAMSLFSQLKPLRRIIRSYGYRVDRNGKLIKEEEYVR